MSLAQQCKIKCDASDISLPPMTVTVRKCLGHTPVIMVSVHKPFKNKIIPKYTYKQCLPAVRCLKTGLYPQELLGSCQMKEEVFCRRREMTLLQTFQCDFRVFTLVSQGHQVGKDLFCLDRNILNDLTI